MSFELEIWTLATVAVTALCIVLGRSCTGAGFTFPRRPGGSGTRQQVTSARRTGTSGTQLSCIVTHTLGRTRALRLFRAIGHWIVKLVKQRERWAAFGRVTQTKPHKHLFQGLVRKAGVLRRAQTFSTHDAW